jgi:hypothetical protein
VTLRRDGADFVVAFYPEDVVVFATTIYLRLERCAPFFAGRSLAITQRLMMKSIANAKLVSPTLETRREAVMAGAGDNGQR